MTPSLRKTWKARVRQLKRELYALLLAYKDPRTPWYARIVAICVLGYAFSPIDLIPDFIPVLGYLDDLILVPLGIVLAIKLIPPVVMEESRVRADALLLQEKPTSWRGALVIVIIWLGLLSLVTWLIVRWFWR